MNPETHAISLPFWYIIQESILFEVRVSGQVLIENEKILFEYRTDTDNLNKMLVYLRRKLRGSFTPETIETGAIQRFYLEPKELSKIEISTPWFSHSSLIYISCKSLSVLEGIPGEKAGTLELQIRKKDRKEAKLLFKPWM
jgi:hypothetical protein